MESGNKKIFFQKSVIKKPGIKLVNVVKPKPVISNLFNDEDDEIEPNLKNVEKDIAKSYGSSITLKRSIKEMNKALEEDSKAFEYDSVYEEMTEKKSAATTSNNTATNHSSINESHAQPKYMEAILKTAAMRKRENDRRMERKIQKERETEDPELADKEVFVTETYRRKLEERQEEDELLRQREKFDEVHAAAKQNNMAQFYRHLVLNQRMVCDEELKVGKAEGSSFTQRTKKNISLRERVDIDDDFKDDPHTETANIKIDSPTSFSPEPENANNNEAVGNAEFDHSTHVSPTATDTENVIEEPPNITKKSLGIRIYDMRNTEETIAAAQLRYLDRKQSNLLYHYLLAGMDDDVND